MAKVTRTGGPGMAKLDAIMEGLGKGNVRVGWFNSAKYEDGTPVAYVAAIQEYGYKSIPARPFMRPTVQEQREAWKRSIALGAKQVMEGKLTGRGLLELLGLKAAGDVAKTISKIQTPPLALSTLLLRKHFQEGGTVTGKLVGETVRNVNMVGPRPKSDKSLSVSGVSKKPLVFQGILINSITAIVEDV